MRIAVFLLLTSVLCLWQSLRPTTTLEAEIANNTSAAQGSPNGNVTPANVSKFKAIGKPSLMNHMSNPVSIRIGRPR